MNEKNIIEISVEIDKIIIGERFKGGVFRPCIDILPSSTIEGAFCNYFNIKLPSCGFFEEETYKFDEIAFSTHDRYFKSAKLPLFSSYMIPTKDKIKAKIYFMDDDLKQFDDLLGRSFLMGAMKSLGFGKTIIKKITSINTSIKQGLLKPCIYENEADKFNISLISPKYGFLFKPDNFHIGGTYIKSVKPGSLVNAPEILLEEETFYDQI